MNTYIRIRLSRYGSISHEYFETLRDTKWVLDLEEAGEHAIYELRIIREIFNRTDALRILRAVHNEEEW